MPNRTQKMIVFTGNHTNSQSSSKLGWFCKVQMKSKHLPTQYVTTIINLWVLLVVTESHSTLEHIQSESAHLHCRVILSLLLLWKIEACIIRGNLPNVIGISRFLSLVHLSCLKFSPYFSSWYWSRQNEKGKKIKKRREKEASSQKLGEVEKTMQHLEKCRLQKLDSGHVLPGWRIFI